MRTVPEESSQHKSIVGTFLFGAFTRALRLAALSAELLLAPAGAAPAESGACSDPSLKDHLSADPHDSKTRHWTRGSLWPQGAQLVTLLYMEVTV